GHNQFFRRAEFLVLGHFKNRVDRFLLRRSDKAAGVDDEDLGFVGVRGKLISVSREDAHHHLAVHKVFGASQTDDSSFWHEKAPSVCGTFGYFSTARSSV